MSEFEEFALKMASFQEIISNSFSKAVNTFDAPEISGIVTKLASNSDRFNELFQNLSLALEQLNKSRPSNYSGLLIDQQFKIIELSHLGNFGTIEALPPEVIDTLLSSDAEIEELDRILIENIGKLLIQSRNITSEFLEISELREFSYLLDRSIFAMECEHYEASQALSTLIWDSYLCRFAGNSNPISKIKPIAIKPNINEMENFAPLYDYGAYGPALVAYKTNPKKPIYSRNATVHEASIKTMNKLNAIKALTIAVGLISRQSRSSSNIKKPPVR